MTQEKPSDIGASFVAFFEEVEPRLSYALAAAYGPQIGKDATADAMAYGWEHWDQLSRMANPAGYLYRVGQTSAKRQRRRGPLFRARLDGAASPFHFDPRYARARIGNASDLGSGHG